MAAPRLKRLLDSAVGAVTVGLLGGVKRLDRRRTADFAAAVMRKVGPLLPEHRIGRDNLRAAFPQISDAEIERILAGVWGNLGRVAVEFAHLDEFSMQGFPPLTADVITYAPEMKPRYETMLESPEPTLIFAAHLANWEIPALVGRMVGLKFAVLYRRPNIAAVSDHIVELRTPLMGELVPTGLAAPVQLARRLQSGTSVGMLVDQHFTRGVEVIFFGRRCMANPLIAQLAAQTGCQIRGIRAIRQPDGYSFVADVTEPVEPKRDAEGRIDVVGTTQAITSVIERWVREYPDQWLWLHRRWR
jgi:Kdo2-lipid IVA lauroyltransferase/acyltransferase